MRLLEKTVDQRVDEESTHGHPGGVLPCAGHPREVTHVGGGALDALTGSLNLVAGLSGLPARGLCIRVGEAAVRILERWLNIEFEGIGRKLHANYALIDPDVCFRVSGLQIVADSFEHATRSTVSCVVLTNTCRQDVDHVEVRDPLDRRVPTE